MIANSAFLAAMVVLLLLFWVMGQLEFLAPYKHAILPRYLWVIVGSIVVLFLNLFAAVLHGDEVAVLEGNRPEARARRTSAADAGHGRARPVRTARPGGVAMSRGGRDDAREDARESAPRAPETPDRGSRRPGVPMDRLTLPRGQERQPVHVRGQVYRLRESESRILATVARSVSCAPTISKRCGPRGMPGPATCGRWRIRACADAHGRSEPRTHRGGRAHTRRQGCARSAPQSWRWRGPRRFTLAWSNRARLATTRSCYRLYQAEAARIEAEGGRIDARRPRLRVEARLPDVPQPPRPTRGRRSRRRHPGIRGRVRAAGVDGHLELPDLRIEFETADGRLEYRDVELVTEHYSRGQMAGKSAAGFALYRAAGAGRARGAGTRKGGTPLDPHHLEWLR